MGINNFHKWVDATFGCTQKASRVDCEDLLVDMNSLVHGAAAESQHAGASPQAHPQAIGGAARRAAAGPHGARVANARSLLRRTRSSGQAHDPTGAAAPRPVRGARRRLRRGRRGRGQVHDADDLAGHGVFEGARRAPRRLGGEAPREGPRLPEGRAVRRVRRRRGRIEGLRVRGHLRRPRRRRV